MKCKHLHGSKGSMIFSLLTAVCLFVYTQASTAQDPEEPGSDTHQESDAHQHEQEQYEGEHHPARHATGAVAVYHAGGLGHDEVHHAGGAAVFFAGCVGPEWLWMEGAGAFLKHEQIRAFPLHALLVFHFHATDIIHPAIGIGPAMHTVFGRGSDIHFGATVEAGIHFWLDGSSGIVVGAEYSMVFGDELEHEIGIKAGPAFRF